MGQEDRTLPIGKSLGEAVAGLVRRRWPNNAAKQIARAWDLDPKTAKNVVQQGHVSERTLTKAIRAEGWDFIAALGVELTGRTYDQHLAYIIEQEAHAQKDRERHRDNVVRLETRARELGAVLARKSA